LEHYLLPGFLCLARYRLRTFYNFCAGTDTAAAGGIHGLAEEDEDILVIVMSFGEVMAALDNGRINCGPVIATMPWLALHCDEIRQRWLA
jgi:ADP-ribose pyrophosphatase